MLEKSGTTFWSTVNEKPAKVARMVDAADCVTVVVVIGKVALVAP
jgi:hypothetical protein